MSRKLVLAFALAIALSSCSKQDPAPGPAQGANQSEIGQAAPRKPLFENREKLDLGMYKGRVVVLELGVVGCTLTGEVYKSINAFAKDPEFSKGLAFVRVDFGQDIGETEAFYKNNPPSFDVFGDPTGAIGKSLPSRAMPTLYIYGKWGDLRYYGGLDDEQFRKMTQTLRTEKKPMDENFWLKKTLDKGSEVIDFTLPDMAGNQVSFAGFRKDAKALLLIFAGTSCPISRDAMQALSTLCEETEDSGLSVIAVNSGQDAESIRKVYEPMELAFPVLVDADEAVAKKYAIDAVPTAFVISADGRIALRSLWNEHAIVQEAKILLGLMKPEDRKEFKEAGTG